MGNEYQTVRLTVDSEIDQMAAEDVGPGDVQSGTTGLRFCTSHGRQPTNEPAFDGRPGRLLETFEW
jgi:hypothetical protein